MGRDKKNEEKTEQFTKWILNHHYLPAWKALSFAARDAYYHLQIRCFAETAQRNHKVKNNNGQVYRSPRKLADDMGCSAKTVMAALADLQAKGWIVCTKLPQLGLEGQGTTAQFRLTMMDTGKQKTRKAPTQEPKRWQEGRDYPVLCYEAYLPKPRKGRIKNITPHPTREQDCTQLGRKQDRNKAVTAPYSGAVMHQKSPMTEPNSGAYLTTISSDNMEDEAEVIEFSQNTGSK